MRRAPPRNPTNMTIKETPPLQGGQSAAAAEAEATRACLSGRSIVLVGLPGVGKSSVGRRLAQRIDLPFVDADSEIEKAAGMAISEIFEHRGESSFRDGEAKVIARLVSGAPMVVATGGGAFMHQDTRQAVAARGVSVWLDAANDVLLNRIRKRSHRPLFAKGDPVKTLRSLRDTRAPQFATADLHVRSSSGPHDRVVSAIIHGLLTHAPFGAPLEQDLEP